MHPPLRLLCVFKKEKINLSLATLSAKFMLQNAFTSLHPSDSETAEAFLIYSGVSLFDGRGGKGRSPEEDYTLFILSPSRNTDIYKEHTQQRYTTEKYKDSFIYVERVYREKNVPHKYLQSTQRHKI